MPSVPHINGTGGRSPVSTDTHGTSAYGHDASKVSSFSFFFAPLLVDEFN